MARAGSAPLVPSDELDIEGGDAPDGRRRRICSANFAACFCRRVPALIDSVRTALAQGDSTAVYRAAHKLKGPLSTIGGRKAARAALALEELGKAADVNGFADGGSGP